MDSATPTAWAGGKGLPREARAARRLLKRGGMNAQLQTTQRFLDEVHSAPGRMIRERVEQTQGALIRARMDKAAIDERISALELDVALLQSDLPARKRIPGWLWFAAAGVGIGGLAATAPFALMTVALLYVGAAATFGSVALPLLIVRGKL